MTSKRAKVPESLLEDLINDKMVELDLTDLSRHSFRSFLFQQLSTSSIHSLSRSLPYCKGLITLSLAGSLSFEGIMGETLLRSLGSLVSLEILNLSECGIAVKEAIVLSKVLSLFKRLKMFVLQKNAIKGSGCAAIANGLKNCHSLSIVDVSFNWIDDQGGIALLQCLSRAVKVNLANNMLSSRFILELSQFLRDNGTIRELLLDHNLIEDQGGALLAYAISSSRISYLSITHNGLHKKSGKAFASLIAQSQHLTHLNLSNNCFEEKGCIEIANAIKSSNIQCLILNENRIGSKGLVAFAKACHSSSICSLSVSGNEGGDWAAFAFADLFQSKTCSLDTLNLDNNCISAKGFLNLLQSLSYNETIADLSVYDFSSSQRVHRDPQTISLIESVLSTLYNKNWTLSRLRSPLTLPKGMNSLLQRNSELEAEEVSMTFLCLFSTLVDTRPVNNLKTLFPHTLDIKAAFTVLSFYGTPLALPQPHSEHAK